MEWKRKYRLSFIKKPHRFYYFPFFFFFFLLSISALFCSTFSFTNTSPDIRRLLSAKADTYFQRGGPKHSEPSDFIMKRCSSMIRYQTTGPEESEKPMDKMMVISKEVKEEVRDLMSPARRYLGGLGSAPPRCLWKCGKCTPCKPVHVPVPPGTPVTAEYYPEAWRCKCGNKLYMP